MAPTEARTVIPMYSYTRVGMNIKSSWTPIQPPKPSNKPLSTTPDSRPTPIRVLTYNIWFDNMFQEQRARDLLRIIQEENPD
ncbi:hypothetical protein FS837_002169, partial [Tulasnella sp. UAMH 9824]